MTTVHSLIVEAADAGIRLDRHLAAQDWAPTRSQIKAALARGDVTVNGALTKAGYMLREGDTLHVTLHPPASPDVVAEPIPLDILFEDRDLLVVNKPPGMVVHPAPGHDRGTLVNALLSHCGDEFAEVGETLRPGIVHRLDKDTSGLLVVAKRPSVHPFLAEQFAEHSIERCYMALCHGPGLPDNVTFDTLHGRHRRDRKRFTTHVTRGRRAVTHVRVEERFDKGAVRVSCRLETGRTHQIRVHLAEHHAPILGDPVYGGRNTSRSRLIDRQALHAQVLGFTHPDGRRLRFERDVPADLGDALEALRRGASWRR